MGLNIGPVRALEKCLIRYPTLTNYPRRYFKYMSP